MARPREGSRIRFILALVAFLVLIGCEALEPKVPQVECRTGDPAGCQQAATIALDEAPAAIGIPTRLVVTSGGLPDCLDPRPNVCPWKVQVVYGDGIDTFARDVTVARANTGEWLLMRVVDVTSAPSPSR